MRPQEHYVQQQCLRTIATCESLQVRDNKRYAAADKFTVQETAEAVKADVGNIDVLVHSLANGPEVTKPLLETSRKVLSVSFLAAQASRCKKQQELQAFWTYQQHRSQP